MKTNEFKIILKNKENLHIIEKTVNVLSFAEAASKAYLAKNLHGHNFEIISVKKLEN